MTTDDRETPATGLTDADLARMLRQVESVVSESFHHAWSVRAEDIAEALRELLAARSKPALSSAEAALAEVVRDYLAHWGGGIPPYWLDRLRAALAPSAGPDTTEGGGES